MRVSDPMEALVQVVHEPAWLVGGAVRDRALGRPTDDYDVALLGDARAVARSLARGTDAHAFALSEMFGVWRVVDREHRWQVDVLPLVGDSIESDLAGRDFTINAIAEPVGGGPYVDPFGGLEDLRARRLRMVSARAFTDDPLRTLRLARLACELDFSVERDTVAAARESSPALAGVAPERIFAELKRILVADRALQGLELMDRTGATDVVLPELGRMRGVEQSQYHHLDVYDHTRSVLGEAITLSLDPAHWLAGPAGGGGAVPGAAIPGAAIPGAAIPGAAVCGESGALIEAVREFLAEPLANELTRAGALRFGALLHDVAKPVTRRVTPEGRVTFVGHDAVGAEMAGEIMTRLRASDRLRDHVAALTRHHLRLGFLVHEMPLGRRAVYRYLRDCEPVQVDVTLLSVADRLATRGRGSEVAIMRHLELARQLLVDALAWRAGRPRAPVRGDELARAVGMRPGRALGRILAELEEASFAGEITSREQAIARARELAAAGSGRARDDR